MKQYKVGIIGGTGMVGQRFITLMENHPWFQPDCHRRQQPQRRQDLMTRRWRAAGPWTSPCRRRPRIWWCWTPRRTRRSWPRMVDFCFCAVDMKKEEIRALEEKYAKLECPIVSNNSAHRWTDDVPMVVPEINADHIWRSSTPSASAWAPSGASSPSSPTAPSRAMSRPCTP